MKNLVYLSLLSIIILPFLVSDAEALSFTTPSNATFTDNLDSYLISSALIEVGMNQGTSYVLDGNNLFIFHVEGDQNLNDPVELWVTRSFDGGLNYQSPIHVDTINTSGFEYNYDTVDVFADGSTVDVFFQEETGLGDRLMYHSRSTDTGATWSTPTQVSDIVYRDVGIAIDGNDILIVGAYEENVITQPLGDDELYSVVSSNGGSSWSSKLQLTTGLDGTFGDTSILDGVKHNGLDFFVAYTVREDVETDPSNDAVFIIKGDGLTWSTPILVSATGLDASGVQLFVDGIDDMAMTLLPTSDDLTIRTSTDEGDTWSSDVTILTDVECDGGNTTVEQLGSELFAFCYHDTNSEFLFRYSANLGATWSSTNTFDPRFNTGDAQAIHLLVATGQPQFIWQEVNDITFDNDYYFTESFDKGVTFSTTVQVLPDDIGSEIQEEDPIMSSTSYVTIVYSDGGQNLLSTTSSQSETPSIFGDKINISQTPSTSESGWRSDGNSKDYADEDNGENTVWMDGDDLHFIYTEEGVPTSNEMAIWYNSFISGVVGTPVLIDQVTIGFNYNIGDETIVGNSTTGNLDVVWREEVGFSDSDINHKRSTDGGATWGSVHPVYQYNATQNNFGGSLFTNGDIIHVFLIDSVVDNLILKRSTDAGLTWSSDIIVNDVPAYVEDQADIVDVIRDGTDWYVLYVIRDDSLDCDGSDCQRLYYTESSDDGLTWSTGLEISTHAPASDRQTFDGQLFIDENDSDNFVAFYNIIDNDLGEIELRFVTSTDGGTSFGGDTLLMDQDDCDEAHSIAFDDWIGHEGDNFVLVCIDNNTDIKYMTSDDFMATNSGVLTLSKTGVDQVNDLYGVSIFNGRTYLAFAEDVPINEGSLFFFESIDYGLSWVSQELTAKIVDPWQVNDSFFQMFITPSSEFVNLLWIANDNGAQVEDDIWLLETSSSSNTIPSLTLTGSNPQQVNQFSPYVESGAVCSDTEEGNISGNVVITGTVNTSVIGSYTKFYDCDDSQGGSAIQISRTVNVVDADAPIISLIGDNPQQILVGSTYIEASATCIDTNDGDITGNLVISGDTVVTTTTGSFDVLYDCQDSNSNNAVQVTRTVNVVTQTTGSSGSSGSTSSVSNPLPSGDSGIGDLTDDQLDDLLEQLAPSQETTFVQEIIQTFFEFRVLDKTHEDLVLNSFLQNQALGIQWTTGDDIIVTSVRPALSPFDFTFEQVPIVKEGSKSALSENSLVYNLDVPETQCSVEFGFDCVEKIRYSVPVTVNALINGTEVEATGTILVDLTEDALNPIVLILIGTILIPIIAGIVWKLKGGNNPTQVKDLLR